MMTTESVLAQKIREHLDDPTLPRYEICLTNVSGECFIPKGVHLFLENCGPVRVTGNGGKNVLSYRNGFGIKIDDYTDGVLLIDNLTEEDGESPDGKWWTDLPSLNGVRGRLANGKARHTNTNGCILEGFKWGLGDAHQGNTRATYYYCGSGEYYAESGSGGSVIDWNGGKIHRCEVKGGSTFRCEGMVINLLYVKEQSELRMINTETVAQVTFTDSVIFIDRCQDKTLHNLSATDCNVTCLNTWIKISVDLKDSISVLQGLLVKKTTTIDGKRTYSSGNEFVLQVDVKNSDWHSVSDVMHEDVTIDTVVARIEKTVFKKQYNATGLTVHSTNAEYKQGYNHSGGSWTSRKDKITGTATVTGLVGRNSAVKTEVTEELTVSGVGHLAMVELKADATAISSFSFVDVDALDVPTLDVDDVAILKAKDTTADISITNVGQAVLERVGDFSASNSIVVSKGNNGRCTGRIGSLVVTGDSDGYRVGSGCNLDVQGDEDASADITGNLSAIGGTVSVAARGTLTLTAPLIVVNGKLTVNGGVDGFNPVINLNGEMASVGDFYTNGFHTDSRGRHKP